MRKNFHIGLNRTYFLLPDSSCISLINTSEFLFWVLPYEQTSKEYLSLEEINIQNNEYILNWNLEKKSIKLYLSYQKQCNIS